jgi:hypothetical protein
MKIVVAIKQVPERDAHVRISSAGKWIEESSLQYSLNESDAYALEEALQLKEKSTTEGGEVIVLSAGPERVGTTIREALAKGADRGIHIVCDDLGARDALGVAKLLAEVQRIWAEGDHPAARELFDRYGVHFDPTLRDEVVGRVEHLNLPSYTGFVMPRLEAVRNAQGEIADVRVTYPLDLTAQMLEYSGKAAGKQA